MPASGWESPPSSKTAAWLEIFICCVDGLSGFAQALEEVYPKCRVQRCIVHQLRNSLKCVNWKDRKQIASDLKTI